MWLVTREGIRPLAALAVAVLATALLAACGGSGADSTSTASNGTNSSTNATGAEAGSGKDSSQSASTKSGSQEQGNGQAQDAEQSKQQGMAQEDSGGSKRKNVETPLEVSGGGSGQFRTKGGDNSIQEFGEESDESELREAAEVVHGFYVSRAAEEWDKACSYLAKSNIEQLEQLAEQSTKSKGADCPTVLKAFTRPLSASVEREITTVDAGSLRHEGEQGFLIYFGAGGVKYAMPLKNEDGSWKVAALSGTTLS
jgi:hypothetical protein